MRPARAARGWANVAGLAAMVVASALPAPARAAGTLPLDFTWEAPPECPTADAVRAQVERVVRVRRGRTPPHLTAWARVEQRGGRWLLRLRTERDGAIGQRDLEAGACAPLVGAATLVLGLAFGEGVELSADPLLQELRGPTVASTPAAASGDRPDTEARPDAVASPGPPLPAAERPPSEVVVRPIAPPSPPRAPLSWALAFDGRGAWGPLPGPAFGAGLGVDAGGRRWFGSARVGFLSRADQSLMFDIRARYRGVDGALSLCGRGALGGHVWLAGCLGAQASVLFSQSVGSTADDNVTAPLYALLPQVRLDVPLSPLISAQASAGLAAAMNRPTFAVTGTSYEYRVPRLSPVLGAGISVRL